MYDKEIIQDMVAAGAWWHLWTAAFSAGMFIAFRLADDAEETEEEYDIFLKFAAQNSNTDDS